MSTTTKRSKAGFTATTLDIARASGVSTATVSYVLSGRKGVRISQKTRDRVLDIARKLHYRPNGLAAALRTGRTNTLGIVAPFSVVGRPSFSHLVYGKDLMLALTFAAARRGLGVMFYVDTPEAPLQPLHVTDRRVDGVILASVDGVQDWVETLASSEIPCVEIGSNFGECQIHPDNGLGARLAVEHLRSLGHRRIAHWRGPDRVFATEERAKTFTAAMGEDSADRPVVRNVGELEALFSGLNPPTALFTYSDHRAVEALHAFSKMNLRVPQDVSVVGFDNDIRAPSVIPPLTTIQNPVQEIAESAVNLLASLISGDEISHKSLRIPTHLVERSSTGALKTATL